MTTTQVFTIPGSGDSKIITIELDETDACRDCGAYPTIGLWTYCDRCMQSLCGQCAWQIDDGVFCKQCKLEASGGLSIQQD